MLETFLYLQPVSKKVTQAGLNSLWEKEYQISVNNWIFYDPFHKKVLLLVILVPGMIHDYQDHEILWWNCAVEVFESSEAADADEVIEAAEILKSRKSVLMTSESSRLLFFRSKKLRSNKIFHKKTIKILSTMNTCLDVIPKHLRELPLLRITWIWGMLKLTM